MHWFTNHNEYIFIYKLLIPWILMHIYFVITVKTQCLPGSSVTFEKLSNVNIRGVNLVPLYTGQQEFLPVSAECNNRCRAASNCKAFLINYSKHSCVGIGYDSETSGFSMVPTDERTSYFDKICLKVPACEKAWTFERVIGKQLQGFDDRVHTGVANRVKCQEMCLKEKEFVCRSGEYEHGSQVCRLSREDRRSQPTAFVSSAASSDYFENQCAHSPIKLNPSRPLNQTLDGQTNSSQSVVGSRLVDNQVSNTDQCAFRRLPAVDLRRADLLRSAATESNCEQLCRSTKAFVCRSFTFEPSSKKCWLNSDDSISAGGPGALIPTPARLYFEQTDCANLRLSCSSHAMQVQLNTLQPFNGRLYAREQPNQCETLARGHTVNQLKLPLPAEGQTEGQCGVRREADGRFSAIVVIQQHPLVQRKGDRLIRLVCSVHGHSQVISSGYQLLSTPTDNEHQLAGEPTTTLVNGSAPAAQVQLRITDLTGSDVVGARLGQQLQLRIERSDVSEALHMQATHLIAMSSTGAQQIALIDGDGCPTDANIFPMLEVLADGRTLVGRFDAFKFADDQVVRFRVNVHFCVGPCKMPQCDLDDGRSNVNASVNAIQINADNEIRNHDDEPKSTSKPITTNQSNQRINSDQHDRSITIESNAHHATTSGAEDAIPEESNTTISLRAAVAKLFSRTKRSDVNHRTRSAWKQQPRASALRTPADAELRREIIVQGLNNNEEDNAAKLLYNQSLDDDLCVSRGSLLMLAISAGLLQILIILMCCICCARRNAAAFTSPALPSRTSLNRCKVSNADTWSAASAARPLPAQMNRYFNRID